MDSALGPLGDAQPLAGERAYYGLTAGKDAFNISGQWISWKPEPGQSRLRPGPGHRSYRERLPATVAGAGEDRGRVVGASLGSSPSQIILWM